MIWLEDRIESWREATSVNGMDSFRSGTPSLLVGKFFVFSKTALKIVTVAD